MFSPILPTSARRTASTVEPSNSSADSAATSAGFFSAISLAILLAKAMKSSFLVTKSVSQLTSTIAPTPSATYEATTPSDVTREPAPAAFVPSLTRRISSALTASPSASVRAFLHIIIGASVLARRSATMLAVIAGIFKLHHLRRPVSWPTVNKLLLGCEKGAMKPPVSQPRHGAGSGDQPSAPTSTNSSPAAETCCTTSFVALALPSSTASATALAYSATALAESSLPGIT